MSVDLLMPVSCTTCTSSAARQRNFENVIYLQ